MRRFTSSLIIAFSLLTITLTAQVITTRSVDTDQKYVVMEELTGTWCQWCPGGTVTGRELTQDYDNIILIAIHCNDDMENTDYYQESGLSAAPSADINRVYHGASIGEWESKALIEMGVTPPAYIDVTTTYDFVSRELEVEISADFIENLSGDYRLGGVVVEDGVVGPSPDYDQSNSYSGGGNGPMGGFENLPSPVPASMIAYDHVARELLGGYTGDAGSLPGSINSGETHSYTYNYTLPVECDPEYVRVVGWLVNQSNGQILNAGKSQYLPGFDDGKPHFISEPQETAFVGTQYNYQIYCADPEEDNLTITAVDIPTWLSLQQTNQSTVHTAGLLSGTPTAQGTYDVVLAVTDGEWTIEKSYQIVVEGAQGGQWEFVGNQGFSTYAPSDQVLGLDSDNTPYVAYKDFSNPIQVMTYDGTNWVQLGSSPGSADSHMDMAIDDNNKPWVIFNNAAGGTKATVKKYNGSSWEQVGLPVSTGPARNVTIAFDNYGTPHVAFYEQDQNYAGYVYRWDGASWSAVGGTSISGEIALFFKLAFDSQNTPHLLWAKAVGYSYYSRVSVFDGSDWSLLGGGDIISEITYFHHNIAIDSNDDIFVSITEGTDINLNVYTFTGSEWQSITENENLVGESQSLAVNSDDEILLGFQNAGLGSQTSVIKYNGSTWSAVGPPTISGVAESQSLKIGNDDTPFISYVDMDNSEKVTVQKYATVAAPVISLSASSIDYDTVGIGDVKEETIVVYNNGNATLEVTDISTTNYVFAANMSSFTLEPNESMDLIVSFEPEEEQEYEGFIQLVCNDPVSSNINIEVRGVGDITIGIHDESISDGLLFWPNPAKDYICINKEKIDMVQIYSIAGEVLHTETMSTKYINISTLDKGIYFVKIFTNGRFQTEKLIVL